MAAAAMSPAATALEQTGGLFLGSAVGSGALPRYTSGVDVRGRPFKYDALAAPGILPYGETVPPDNLAVGTLGDGSVPPPPPPTADLALGNRDPPSYSESLPGGVMRNELSEWLTPKLNELASAPEVWTRDSLWQHFSAGDSVIYVPDDHGGFSFPVERAVFDRVLGDYLAQPAKPKNGSVPLPPLVGIEPNPGPGRKGKKLQKKKKAVRKKSGIVMQKNSAVRRSAPVQVSYSMKPGFAFSGAMYDGRPGLRVSSSQRLCDVQTLITTGVASFVNGATGSSIGTNYFTLASTGFGVPLDNIANSFFQWRLHSLTFRYIPICSSATSGYLTFGVTADPDYDTAQVTRAQISQLEESCDTSMWVECVVHAHNAPKNILWTYDGAGNDDRLACAGGFLMAGVQNPAPAATGIVGSIYVDYVMEFYSMGDSATLKLSLPQLLKQRHALAKKLDALDSHIKQNLEESLRPKEPVPLDPFDFDVEDYKNSCVSSPAPPGGPVPRRR
jgi:hypothetical protein